MNHENKERMDDKNNEDKIWIRLDQYTSIDGVLWRYFIIKTKIGFYKDLIAFEMK